MGELSEVVSGALLSMLAMPEEEQINRVNTQTGVTNNKTNMSCFASHEIFIMYKRKTFTMPAGTQALLICTRVLLFLSYR